MSGTWRLLVDPPASGEWNMAVDEALLLDCAESGPTLRLYTWDTPTVSLGYRQERLGWLNRARAKFLKWTLARYTIGLHLTGFTEHQNRQRVTTNSSGLYFSISLIETYIPFPVRGELIPEE